MLYVSLFLSPQLSKVIADLNNSHDHEQYNDTDIQEFQMAEINDL